MLCFLLPMFLLWFPHFRCRCWELTRVSTNDGHVPDFETHETEEVAMAAMCRRGQAMTTVRMSVPSVRIHLAVFPLAHIDTHAVWPEAPLLDCFSSGS